MSKRSNANEVLVELLVATVYMNSPSTGMYTQSAKLQPVGKVTAPVSITVPKVDEPSTRS
jgi:hypothetical protein